MKVKKVTSMIMIGFALLLGSTTFTSCTEEELDELFGYESDDDDFGSSSGSSGNSGSSGGNSNDCSLDNYNSMGIDTQYEVQCQAAYAYWCAGETSALAQQCDYYAQLQASLGLPNCQYCN